MAHAGIHGTSGGIPTSDLVPSKYDWRNPVAYIAVKHKKGETSLRDKVLTSTDAVGKLASIPVVSQVVNAANAMKPTRKILEATLGVHAEAPLPNYNSNTAAKRLRAV